MRGISAVIATILLLVMVVVITAGVFYFFRGTMGTATTKGTQAVQTAITQTDVEANVQVIRWYNNSGYLYFTIKNGLDSSITVKTIYLEDQQKDINQDVGTGAIQDINTTIAWDADAKASYNGKEAIIVINYGGKDWTIRSVVSVS